MGPSWGAVVSACCTEGPLGHSQQGNGDSPVICQAGMVGQVLDPVCVLTGSHTGDGEDTSQQVMS